MNIPPDLPLPRPARGKKVNLRATFSFDPIGPTPFELNLAVEYSVQAFELWGLTFGRTCRLLFAASFPSLADLENAKNYFESTNPDPGARLTAEVGAEVYLKLPQPPDLDFLQIRSGDAGGWLKVRLAARAGWSPAGGDLSLTGEFVDPVQVEFHVPGIKLPQPLGRLTVDSIKGDVTISKVGSNVELSGTLGGSGQIVLRPQFESLDLPMAEYLAYLLHGITPDRLSATVSIRLDLNRNAPQVTVTCELQGAGINIDLFGVLAQLAQGRAAPAGVPEGGDTGNGHFGFELSGLKLILSRTPSLALSMRGQLGPVELPQAFLKLSFTEVEVGLGSADPTDTTPAVRIPLRLPRVTRQEMGFYGPAAEVHRNPGEKPPPDQAIWDLLAHSEDREACARYDAMVETLLATTELMSGANPDAAGMLVGYKENGKWSFKVPPDLRESSRFRLAVGTVRDSGDLLLACQIERDWHLLAASLALQIDNFAFRIALRNPRDIRLSSTVHLVVDGPLAPISNVALTGGLSADMIFFALEARGATTVEIPEIVPGYGGGSITVGRLAFGFGYTKRSVAIAFDGGLKLPEKLVDDLDTADLVGAGIRLPVQSRLAFQFDLIPLVVGDVVIPIPMFQFNWDLRRDVSPGLRDMRTCEPYWDGLQLIVQDVIRLSLKRISYNPILGMGACSNSDFDGDLVLGDAQNGLTVVADNIFWAYGPDSWYALLILPVAGYPFCDNFCVNLKLAGFKLHFNLQRPIPAFSPFAIFELMALLADPRHYKIKPGGELANTVRATLQDAYVQLPDPVRELFPQADRVLRKPVNLAINLADFINLVQVVGNGLESLVGAAIRALREGKQAAVELQQAVARLQPGSQAELVGKMLGSLPPELRKVRLGASFAGFEGSAVIVLMDRQSARSAFANRAGPPRDIPPVSAITREMRHDPEALRGFVPLLPPGGPRLPDSMDPREHPLRGAEFDAFGQGDLDALTPGFSEALLDADQIHPALILRLKSPAQDDRVSSYLFNRFSSRLQRLIRGYSGSGPLPEALRKTLVGELNGIIQGGSNRREMIYDSGRFDQVALSQLTQRLLDKYDQHLGNSPSGWPLQEQELARLNRLFLEAVFPQELPQDAGVLVAARVRVFGGQRFRFLGYVLANGAFSLVTATNIEPLRLAVAGLPVDLPLRVDGRLELSGRARRGLALGMIQAVGSADWPPVPGILSLHIGPASLTLFSTGQFALGGPVDVWLFNGAAHIRGTVDVTPQHCFVTGALVYRPGNGKLVELLLDVSGRVGPQQRFEFAGTGEVRLFGTPLSKVRASVSNDGAEIAGQLHTKVLSAAGIEVPCALAMDLAGRVSLGRTTRPQFDLTGSGVLNLFGMKISGRGGIRARAGYTTTFLEGKLDWQGHPWLAARVEVGNKGIRVSGETTFVLRGPDSIGTMQVAVPIIQVTVRGSFTLDLSGNLAAFDISGTTLLAIQLPDKAQNFPIATDSFRRHGSATEPIRLLSVRGVSPVPGGTLPVTFPTLTIDVSEDISTEVLKISVPDLTWSEGSVKTQNSWPFVIVNLPTLTFNQADTYTIHGLKASAEWENRSLKLFEGLPSFDVSLKWDGAQKVFLPVVTII